MVGFTPAHLGRRRRGRVHFTSGRPAPRTMIISGGPKQSLGVAVGGFLPRTIDNQHSSTIPGVKENVKIIDALPPDDTCGATLPRGADRRANTRRRSVSSAVSVSYAATRIAGLQDPRAEPLRADRQPLAPAQAKWPTRTTQRSLGSSPTYPQGTFSLIFKSS